MSFITLRFLVWWNSDWSGAEVVPVWASDGTLVTVGWTQLYTCLGGKTDGWLTDWLTEWINTWINSTCLDSKCVFSPQLMQEKVGLLKLYKMACCACLLSHHLQEHDTSVVILQSSLGLDTGLRGNFDLVSVSSRPRLSSVLLLSWPRTWWSRGDFENQGGWPLLLQSSNATSKMYLF